MQRVVLVRHNSYLFKGTVEENLKMAKPDADIFQKVLDETGILPNETLFIDDSEANCRTAEALGISTYTPKAHEDWRHAVVL